MNTIRPTFQDLPTVLLAHIGGFVDTPLAYLRTSKQISKQAGSMLNRKDTLVSELLQYDGLPKQIQQGFFGTTWQSSIKELDLYGIFKLDKDLDFFCDRYERKSKKASTYNDKVLQRIVATFPNLQKLRIPYRLVYPKDDPNIMYCMAPNPTKVRGFFSEKSIKKLARLPHLEELDVSGVKLKDDSLIHHVAQIKTLKKLRVLEVTHKDLRRLKDLPKLEELHLEDQGHFWGEGSISRRDLQYIGNNFRTLRKLVGISPYIAPEELKKFPHLTITEISYKNIEIANEERKKRIQKMFQWPEKKAVPNQWPALKNILYSAWIISTFFIKVCIQLVIFAVQITRAKLTRLIGTTAEQTG